MTLGNPSRPVHRFVFLVVIVAAPAARAEVCPPAVSLSGDEAAVAEVRELLDARGITGDATRCPAVHARIERRGPQLVVGVDGPDGVPIERMVSEVATAATVIESWTRSDVAAPLLASRAVPALEAADEPVRPSPPAARGIQLFAAAETSFASDSTVWQGLQLQACIMVGPVCAAARVHGGKVVSQPAGWDGFARNGAEAYIGIDIPIAFGSTRLTPGFAAGYGAMFTRMTSAGERNGVEISGPRAEVHAAFSVPLTDHLAIDLVTTGALTQATRMEVHGRDVAPPLAFPDEPRALVRFALGVRYGAR